jgi:hypothetical protein
VSIRLKRLSRVHSLVFRTVLGKRVVLMRNLVQLRKGKKKKTLVGHEAGSGHKPGLRKHVLKRTTVEIVWNQFRSWSTFYRIYTQPASDGKSRRLGVQTIPS